MQQTTLARESQLRALRHYFPVSAKQAKHPTDSQEKIFIGRPRVAAEKGGHFVHDVRECVRATEGLGWCSDLEALKFPSAVKVLRPEVPRSGKSAVVSEGGVSAFDEYHSSIGGSPADVDAFLQHSPKVPFVAVGWTRRRELIRNAGDGRGAGRTIHDRS